MARDTTPVRSRTHEEEKQLLSQLAGEARYTVFVASDFHLGIGRDPDTGTFSLMENFLADETFSRCLAHYEAEAREGAALVLNGDVFDFLRIPQYPRTDEDYALWAERLAWLDAEGGAVALDRPVARVERRFGLRTQDYKTVWKLLLIITGHGRFFTALTEWIGAGGRLIIVKGNHDVELHWPLVRRAIRDELVRRGAPTDSVESHVAFADGAFTLGNLHLEHGHQYEAMTRVVGGPTLERDSRQINLPLGSFINRYFINRIERLSPFIDNIKPVQDALLKLLRRYPIKILRFYFEAWRFVWRAVSKRRFEGSVALILAGLLVPLATMALIVVFILWPELAERLTGWLPFLQRRSGRVGSSVIGLLFPAFLPYVVAALREVAKRFGFLRPRDHLAEAAPGALLKSFPYLDRPRRVYAIMGHTHVQDVRRLSAAPREEYYVNVGTWVPLWPEERPDLIGRVVYSFARFDRTEQGEYRHQALEWDDQAKEPREARILVAVERPGH